MLCTILVHFLFITPPTLCSMLLPHAYTASLLLLFTFTLLQRTFQSPTKAGLCLKVLNNAIVSNVQQFFCDMKQPRDFREIQMCNQMLKVIPNDHGTKKINGHQVFDRLITNHLSVRRKSIAKHCNNKFHLEKCRQPRTGLTKKSLIKLPV